RRRQRRTHNPGAFCASNVTDHFRAQDLRKSPPVKTQHQTRFALILLLALLEPTVARTAPSDNTPTVAPTIDLPTHDGRIKSADLAGKVIYVDFWASWCGPCQASFPWLKSMHEQYGTKGLVIVAINVDK